MTSMHCLKPIYFYQKLTFKEYIIPKYQWEYLHY